MKTKEELNALKEEVEAVSRKLRQLTDEELVQVSGGLGEDIPIPGRGKDFNNQSAADDRLIKVLD